MTSIEISTQLHHIQHHHTNHLTNHNVHVKTEAFASNCPVEALDVVASMAQPETDAKAVSY